MPSSKIATLRILDEVNCVFVGLSPDHLGYLSDKFALFAANYYFNPKYKLGQWDGKIRWFHATGRTFVNLLNEILPLVIKLGYRIKVQDLRKSDRIRPKNIDESFFSNIIDPRTNEPWVVRDYQIELVNSLFEAGNGIAIAGTGAGKAQSVNSKILTLYGWKRMGDLKIGDFVITPRSNVVPIIGIFPQGKKQLYKLTFHDGSTTLACKEHLWKARVPALSHKASTEDRVISTQDMIDFLERKKSGVHTPGNISIPLCSTIGATGGFGGIDKLTIPPYLLGLLIGDGCLTGRSIVFSNKNKQILESVKQEIAIYDLQLKFRSGSNCDYGIVKLDPQNSFPPSKNRLMVEIQQLNLNVDAAHKFVPEQYKTATIPTRVQILQGLFDTNGTVGKRGDISFTTVSEQLAKDVQEIVWSLGGTCTITTRIPTYTYQDELKVGKLAYTCHVRHPTPKNLFFSCENKRQRCKEYHADGRIQLMRRLINVEPASIEEAQCIMIDDPEHLYITDDYIVTHNTSMCAALALSYEREANFRSLIIVPDKNLTLQTREQYSFFGLDVGEFSGSRKDLEHMHVVSIWKCLKNSPEIIKQFNVVIVDECHGLRGKILSELLNDYGKDIPYRFGVTGTLPKDESDKRAVVVAVGNVQYNVPAHKLMAEGHLAELEIDILQTDIDLRSQYNLYLEEQKYFKDHSDITHTFDDPLTYIQFVEQYFTDWPAEKRFLQQEQHRLNWIVNYLQQKRDEKKGNTLVLVDGVSFGKKLANLIPDATFLYGKTDMKERKQAYDAFKNNDNLLLIATVQIASTGLDIPRIFNLVGIDLGKSFVRVIQSIGRSLRKANDKDKAHFTDICANLKYSKRHLRERIKYYKEAKYKHTKQVVDLATIDKYSHDALL